MLPCVTFLDTQHPYQLSTPAPRRRKRVLPIAEEGLRQNTRFLRRLKLWHQRASRWGRRVCGGGGGFERGGGRVVDFAVAVLLLKQTRKGVGGMQ